MKNWKSHIGLLLFGLLMGIASPTFAQNSPRAVALTIVEDQLQLGEVTLPGNSRYVDFNPLDPVRYARVDDFGALLFVPAGGPEGYYSFSPYFEGFSAPSIDENWLRVAETAWSPNGEMLAFRIASNHETGNDGVWFWQPAREIATDPSYHILRDCPPRCDLVTRVNAEEWRSMGIEWAPDNAAVLISLQLPKENNRRAYTIRFAARDVETTQSRTGPSVSRYDTAHWSSDGQRVIVSGFDANGQVVFGSIGRDGSLPLITPAVDIGMLWVQDAVQQPDTGQIIMFGSNVGLNSPLQLIDSTGAALTAPIGSARPDAIRWNQARTAALLIIGGNYYVAQVSGTVTDITSLTGGTSNVDWVEGRLPSSAALRPLPEPISTAEDVATNNNQSSTPEWFVGLLLEVNLPALTVYNEPTADSAVVTELAEGEPLILTAGPLVDGATTWWRIQTIDFSGWVPEQIDGQPTLREPTEPVG